MSDIVLRIRRLQPLVHKLYLKKRGKGAYFKLFVFSDVAELRHFAHEQSKIVGERHGCQFSYWKRCLGAARWWGLKQFERAPNYLGCVLLCRQFLGSMIVSHEMTHAAVFATLKSRRPTRFTRAHDEQVAELQGWLVSQFYSWLWRQNRRKPCG